MSKITDAAKDLPSEPEFALLTFAESVRRYYSSSELTDEDSVFVLRFLRKFLDRFACEVKINFPSNEPVKRQAIIVVSEILKYKPDLLAKKVDSEIDDILSNYSDKLEESFGLARLNGEEKKKILQSLENVRRTIEESELSDRKKNALFERLAELIREVNTHGTRTDRFFAFAGDVAFVLGDMASKAKPLLSEVKEMLRIISRARARQEGVSLPPGDEPLRLPSLEGSSIAESEEA